MWSNTCRARSEGSGAARSLASISSDQQQQVAEQDRRARAELRRRDPCQPGPLHAGEAAGAPPARRAQVAGVHHVVVDQGAGLEELERGGRGDERAVVASPAPRQPQ